MEWCPAGRSVCLPLLIFPCTIKVQKFSSGTGSPGWSRRKGNKTVVVCGVSCFIMWLYVHVCVSEHTSISLLILCAYPILSCKQLHPVSFLLNKYAMLCYLDEVLEYRFKADWLVREFPFMLYRVFHLYSWNFGTRLHQDFTLCEPTWGRQQHDTWMWPRTWQIRCKSTAMTMLTITSAWKDTTSINCLHVHAWNTWNTLSKTLS